MRPLASAAQPRYPSSMTLLRATALAAAVTLAGCGYSPLYAPAAGAANAAQRVEIGAVDMQNVVKNVGQRRVAQTVAQELKLNFPNSGGNLDTVTVSIRESTSTLAVQRTAAIQRAQINLVGGVLLTNANGDRLLNTELSTSVPYNVEDTPYSTESGKTYARRTAARNLAAEISRRLYLYYSTHPATGASVAAPASQPAPTVKTANPSFE